VRDEVLKSTDRKQEPFVYGSLGGAEIALVPAPASVRREVEGMSSRALLGVLASQHKGTPANDCIAVRLAQLARIEAAGRGGGQEEGGRWGPAPRPKPSVSTSTSSRSPTPPC
jgi:hypothetical protein